MARDDSHLGPQAMKMIGEGIAQDIAAPNRESLGWFAHEVGMTYEYEDKRRPMDVATKGLPSPTPSAFPATALTPDQPPFRGSQPAQS